MGCFWSSEPRDYCQHCNRRAVNNLVIIDHICELCISRATRRDQAPRSRGPFFGEYRCRGCRRFWTSRLSWPDKNQICKRCKQPTLPFNQRELLPTDMAQDKKNGEEHQKELCQMCQQLGYYCGKFSNRCSKPKENYNHTKKICYRPKKYY